MADKIMMTTAGLKEREDRLEYLKTVRRKEIAEKLKEAREQGDLSENAEYDAAKDAQSDNEAEIAQLEEILKKVEVVDETEATLDAVNIGNRVKIEDEEFHDTMEFYIVGGQEANSLEGKISNDSPVGRALLGKKVGEYVQVETPTGEMTYKILEIQKAI